MQDTIAPSQATLVFPLSKNDTEVLLGIKAHKIGAGYRNGFGGGKESGENLIDCAIRELREESGLTVERFNLEQVAQVNFHNMKKDGTVFVCRAHVFLARFCKGQPRETAEMFNPKWFGTHSLPFELMMPGDRYWLLPIFEGKKIIADVYYDSGQKLICPVNITEIALCFAG